MSTKKKDTSSIIIGIIVLGIILWKIIGYLLPDQSSYITSHELLSDVIEKHAILKDWNQIKQLKFTKSVELFQEDGSSEISRIEEHKYIYAAPVKKEIHWVQERKNYVLTNIGNKIFQTVNNYVDTTKTEHQLRAKINAAEFVLKLPHSLKSTSASLVYEGIQEFQEKPCHTLKINFKDSEDVWWMYFQESTLDWVGYWVKTSGHYSMVINEEMEVVDGFTLSRKRKSYRTDSLQNKTYLRAAYYYGNYQID